MKFRSLPTGGNPILITDIYRSIIADQEGELFLEKLFPGKTVFAVSSGSAGLRLALEAMKQYSSRKEVVLPGYTCPSVLAAVINSGLKPVLCDLSPASFTLDLHDLQRKIGTETLAIVAVHLYGLTEHVTMIKDIAARYNILILEDSAQALHNDKGKDHASRTDNVGDLSVSSFGRGKPFSLLSGGVVIVNNPALCDKVQNIYTALPQSIPKGFPTLEVLKLFAYSLLFHPHLFWIPQTLPFLHIGETIFTLESDYNKMQRLTKNLGQIMLDELDHILANRRDLSHQYSTHLKDIRTHFEFFPHSDNSHTLLRFPLIFRDSMKRDRCLSALKRSGLGASGSYPCPLNQMDGARHFFDTQGKFPNAAATASKVLTLPLHQYVKPGEIKNIYDILAYHLSQ